LLSRAEGRATGFRSRPRIAFAAAGTGSQGYGKIKQASHIHLLDLVLDCPGQSDPGGVQGNRAKHAFS